MDKPGEEIARVLYKLETREVFDGMSVGLYETAAFADKTKIIFIDIKTGKKTGEIKTFVSRFHFAGMDQNYNQIRYMLMSDCQIYLAYQSNLVETCFDYYKFNF